MGDVSIKVMFLHSELWGQLSPLEGQILCFSTNFGSVFKFSMAYAVYDDTYINAYNLYNHAHFYP